MKQNCTFEDDSLLINTGENVIEIEAEKGRKSGPGVPDSVTTNKWREGGEGRDESNMKG